MENLIKADISKDNITSAVAAITQAVDNGDINALQAAAMLNWYAKVAEQARKQIIDQALDEVAKYGKGECTVLGFKISQMEGGTKYDYSGCGDIEWERWEAQVKSATESRKGREEFLKVLKAPVTLVYEETGEVYTVHPPVKSSTTTIKFS